MAKEFIEGTEKITPGFANGISLQLAEKQKTEGPKATLSKTELLKIKVEAAYHYGKFLEALGVDWASDPNSSDTPNRVAKAYVDDLWRGRYQPLTSVTAFPSDGYTGIVQESNIELTSMCSHHHQAIEGYVSIAYIPGEDGQVVGLSKLNRIVEHFGRRGQIQEGLTSQIHYAIDKMCKGNIGVAVAVNATHACVKCRGVKHKGASMQTALLSGVFDVEPAARAEFYKNIELSQKLT